MNEKEKQNRWNTIHSEIGTREDIRKQYDGWIESNEKMATVLKNCKTPIVDLGCGSGNNTLHFIEEGKQVIACDFSDVAIKKIQENIPEAVTNQFNMINGIPFNDKFTDLIVADLSLHYFSTEETNRLILEIRRVLNDGGYLMCRVNSTKDSNFGAGQGTKLEENFYLTRGTTKRFFDEESLRNFFDSENWEIVYINEGEMKEENIRTLWQETAKENAKKKILWTVCLRKRR